MPAKDDVVQKVSLALEARRIKAHWRPRVLATLNGQEVKLAKFRGTFVWHHHADADELLLGVNGRFRVEFAHHYVDLGPGECVVIPRGTEHRTSAEEDAEVLIFEPAGTRNTGNIKHPTLTAPVASARRRVRGSRPRTT
ncbi:MAG: cupin domain-containing protein [Acidobacteriota bacterium]